MPERPPQFIKDFSKEYSKEERNEIAKGIKEKRAEYFNNKEIQSSNLKKQESLEVEISEREQCIGSVQKEIEEMEGYLHKKRLGIIERISRWINIKNLRDQICEKRSEKLSEGDALVEIRQELEELESINLDFNGLKEAKEVLNDFYNNQSEKWQKFDRESKDREIKNIVEKYDCMFIHTISYKSSGWENSPIAGGLNCQTQMEIVMALQPDLSTSTLRKGDNNESIYARPVGIILKGGNVLSASKEDAATKASSLVKENLGRNDFMNQLVPIGKRIQVAVKEKEADTHNEFIIDRPEVAGFFVVEDMKWNLDENVINGMEYLSYIYPFLKKYGIPAYQIKNGEACEVEYNEKANTFESRKKISNQELLSNGFKLTAEQREEMINDLIEEKPYSNSKYGKEGLFFDNLSFGKSAYIIYLLGNRKENLMQMGESKPYSKKTRAFLEQFLSNEFDQKILNESNKVFTYEIKQIDTITTYLVFDNVEKVYECTNAERLRKPGLSRNNHTSLIGFEDLIHYRIRADRLDKTGNYFEIIQKDLKETKEKIEEIEQLNKEELHPTKIEYLENQKQHILYRVFELYGFGEAAKEFGDEETYRKAFTMAQEIIPLSKYLAFKEKRFKPDGGFKVYKEDLFFENKDVV